MATVAETLASFDNLEKVEHRPMEFVDPRWLTLETELATLQDGTGLVVDAQASVAALKAKSRNPTQYGDNWAATRATISDGALLDAP